IVDRALSPTEWERWQQKAEYALGIPDGDIIGRAGAHLAGALAGAWLIGEICGIKDFHKPVFEAAKNTLDTIADDLVYKGLTPGDQLLSAVSDFMATNPGSFPTRNEYAGAIVGS